MIYRFHIRNFKKFLDLDLPFSSLTVLTGVNSGGKSSVIQGLVLTKAALASTGRVALNGSNGLSLGEASDVLCVEAEEPRIEFEMFTGGTATRVSFDIPSERTTTLIGTAVSESSLPDSGEIDSSLYYLSAERLGPRDLQEVSSEFDATMTLGHQGEFTAHVLSRLGREQVDLDRQHPDTGSLGGVITLSAQTEYWLSSITRPIQIDAQWLAGTNSASLRFKSPDILTEWLRPSNVGFGISHALPIVVAGLLAPKGGILIVENPESHLQPAGQSTIGRFLVRVASSGVQVLVETHSDHVLNGIRLGIGADRVLSPDEALIHYFSADSAVETLQLDRTGSLSRWPRGFFDQGEQDLSVLAESKRRE